MRCVTNVTSTDRHTSICVIPENLSPCKLGHLFWPLACYIKSATCHMDSESRTMFKSGFSGPRQLQALQI